MENLVGVCLLLGVGIGIALAIFSRKAKLKKPEDKPVPDKPIPIHQSPPRFYEEGDKLEIRRVGDKDYCLTTLVIKQVFVQANHADYGLQSDVPIREGKLTRLAIEREGDFTIGGVVLIAPKIDKRWSLFGEWFLNTQPQFLEVSLLLQHGLALPLTMCAMNDYKLGFTIKGRENCVGTPFLLLTYAFEETLVKKEGD